MSPIQQIFLGLGAVAKKTYIDDIFSTYLWEGNSTENRNINNGINLSGEGGMVWIKKRNATDDNLVYDTNRGHNERIITNSDTDNGGLGQRLTGFNTNGFKLGNNTQVNASSNTYSSWTFRKAPGFFDAIAYTGNGTSGRAISHSLGCRPGFVIVKRTIGGVGDWKCLHRYDFDKYLELNQTQAAASSSSDFPSHPTSTTFTVSSDAAVNKNGDSYVAYLFAGGESTAATARSVDFDGSGDTLFAPNSSDYSFGSGDFTVEGWFKIDQQSSQNGIVGVWGYSASRRSWLIQTDNSANGPLEFFISPDGGNGNLTSCSGGNVSLGLWYHFAAVRTGNTLKLFLNGAEVATSSFSGSLYDNTNDNLHIGSVFDQTDFTNGQISNIRITKGQALYTSSFKVTTEPLTTTSQGATASNVKLLCCNNSSVTGATVSSGTMTTSGDPTASTDSPFDDPAAHVFGESASESVIKCGSYVGNGSTDGPEINLGWQPQWVLIKWASGSQDWILLDTMRGIPTDQYDTDLRPNLNAADWTHRDWIDISPTGFKLKSNPDHSNGNGEDYVFVAIRGSDGYVGKPPELGTDVFAMDTGAGGSTVPGFDSGFTVDLGIARRPASGDNWYAYTRLNGTKYIRTDTNDPEGNDTNTAWDSNVGWYTAISSTYQSWMWKRHAGFDVVHYIGNGTAGRQIPHNLSKTPEMIWVKTRSISTAQNWMVGHKGLNGGTNPWEYYINLNTTGTTADYPIWNDLAPTSTHFNLGTVLPQTNNNNETYSAFLFASVSGISKVGYYTGNGSTGQTITLGFAPRFVIIRRTNSDQYWTVLDTVRGWDGTNDPELYLNYSGGQNPASSSAPTSNGFTLSDSSANVNNTNDKYIYYAHA